MTSSASPPTPDGRERSAPRTEKAAQSVARRIAHDIAARRLREGSKLPSESVMMAGQRVSRGTLREALRLLEVQGLIAIRPGRGGGPIVRQVDGADFGRMATLHLLVKGGTFGDLIEARLALEPVAARLGALHRDRGAVETLRDLLQDQTGSSPGAGKSGDLAKSAAFHEVLTGLSGNPVLDLYTSSLAAIFKSRVAGGVFPTEARHQVDESHDAIARAIIDGDAAAAERHMREHMMEFVEFWQTQYPGLLGEVIDWA